MSTVGLPAGLTGTVPVTVTGKTRLLPTLGSGLTVLVGGVVSISHYRKQIIPTTLNLRW